MELNKRNLMKFLKSGSVWDQPCATGLELLEKLLRRRRSLRWVYDRMVAHDDAQGDWNVGWAYERIMDTLPISKHGILPTLWPDKGLPFAVFKRAFGKLSE